MRTGTKLIATAAVALACATVTTTAASAASGSASGSTTTPKMVKSVDYGTMCHGELWAEYQSGTPYTQARVFAANGITCKGWLERERTGQYGWTKVSDYMFAVGGSPKYSGWHWDGSSSTDNTVQSRVCIQEVETSAPVVCSGGW
ncbi:MAG: hypothetical protein HOV83_33370 [Catenulispora sp.]|nr:hypothetical protein [Catenulispora sp.]